MRIARGTRNQQSNGFMSQHARNNPDLPPVHDIHADGLSAARRRTGRPLSGASPRVRLTAHVCAQTEAQIAAWTAAVNDPRFRDGQTLDALVAHGLASRWAPRKPEATP